MNKEIESQIGQYLARYNFGRPPQLDDDIFELGTITSLVAMQLLLFVEKKWAISVPASELKRENFRTVANLSALVRRYLEIEAA